MALLLAATGRRWEPLLRVAVIAVISGVIAAIHWGPYLLATRHHPRTNPRRCTICRCPARS